MQRHRRQVKSPGSRGFTLIELMIVITILAITAAIAVGAIRQDEVAGSYKRFVDDLQGKVVQGRDFAVDNQTRVRLDYYGDRVEMRTYNQVTDQWEAFGAERVGNVDGGILDNTCILGLQSGTVPPSQAQNLGKIAPPANCLGSVQQMMFEPDGSFNVITDGVLTVENAGATLWVADKTVPAKTKLSMIQFFPGGLMRVFNDVD